MHTLQSVPFGSTFDSRRDVTCIDRADGVPSRRSSKRSSSCSCSSSSSGSSPSGDFASTRSPLPEARSVRRVDRRFPRQSSVGTGRGHAQHCGLQVAAIENVTDTYFAKYAIWSTFEGVALHGVGAGFNECHHQGRRGRPRERRRGNADDRSSCRKRKTHRFCGIVAPAYGEPGGGVEVIFVNGSPDGTVTGPETIPDK